MAAAIAIFFVAGPLFNMKLENLSADSSMVKVISLGVISGFAGIRLLKAMSENLMKKVQRLDYKIKKIEKSEELDELITQANFLLDKNIKRAKAIYERVLQIDPDNRAAMVGKARVLNREGKVEEAIQLLSEVINKYPKAERAYYLRACYKNELKKYSKKEVLADLAKAIEISEIYKEYARNDEDFDNLNKEFKELVGL